MAATANMSAARLIRFATSPRPGATPVITVWMPTDTSAYAQQASARVEMIQSRRARPRARNANVACRTVPPQVASMMKIA
jgi:hypothetical protein